MKILFLCTAHNSLSQRLYLVLSSTHDVSIEYALSDELMISAVALWRPDLIICPFLTTLVPKQIYEKYMTLILHPGPPGDAGPSALDWVLMGDDGRIDDPDQLLKHLDTEACQPGRSHWGVTVLQAIEEFDAGPVWAFEQFRIDIDDPRLTKSQLYRGPLTQAAVAATLAAVSRIQDAAYSSGHDFAGSSKTYRSNCMVYEQVTFRPSLQAPPGYRLYSVTDSKPFLGGPRHHRPLLKAAEREFDLTRHTAQQCSRRIRCGDSQPGVLSKAFGHKLYLYGGVVEGNVGNLPRSPVPGTILATRREAVCIATCDKKGLWITHVRRPKTKADKALWPKVPATTALVELDVITAVQVRQLNWAINLDWSRSPSKTFQEVWIDFQVDENRNKTAYLYFDFYNGAMSTSQCSHLVDAMQYIIKRSSPKEPVRAVVLMGGAYFSNGIALNVIEAAADSATESWYNINRIDDVVLYLLQEFPAHGILTVAGMRGNAAAGGVALAAACDVVIAGSDIVLNPAYRAVGLYGSEYHTITYSARCGKAKATEILRAMTPMSPLQARKIGLIDYIFPGTGKDLEDSIRFHVEMLIKNEVLVKGNWKYKQDLSPPVLAGARATELSEMCKDFWSARSDRYHTRRFDFVRKVKAQQTPLRFATHRRRHNGALLDEEELESFDDVEYYEKLAARRASVTLRDLVRHELGSLVSKWAQNEVRPQPYADGPVGLLAEKKEAHVALPGKERKMSTVFSCYYKPVEPTFETPLTPPISPLKHEDAKEFPIFS